MKLIMIYGRMNPIHEGHAKMLLQVKRRAHSEGADFKVFLTQTKDKDKNPLAYKDKLRFLRLVVGVAPTDEGYETNNLFGLVRSLSEHYTEIELVFGGDRFKTFGPLMEKYQETFKCPVFVSNFADRDKYPYSATEMRKLATEGNYEDFMSKCPSMFTSTQKLQLFTLVSVGLTNTVDGRYNRKPRAARIPSEGKE